MSLRPLRNAGFTILELLMAMALFTIAAVSLAEALNVISITVTESIDDAELREQLRAVLTEVTHDPHLTEDVRETEATKQGMVFRIEVERIDLKNQKGVTLTNLFSVKVTGLKVGPGGRKEELDTATTIVNPTLF